MQDEKRISAILKTPWATDGKNFSQRLWTSREQLIGTLQAELTRALITGADSASVAKTIAQKMNAAEYAASRLVQTEITRIITESDKDTFAEMNIDEVEIVGTLDGHTCGTCGDMDGNHVPRSEAHAGTTAPPFHPNCRCVIVPYFGDEFRDEYRIMRDPETGKSKIVENMTFKEWKEKYGGGNAPKNVAPNEKQKTPGKAEQKAANGDIIKKAEAEPVKEPEPVIEHRIPESEDYNRALRESQKAVSVEKRDQIANHKKADGSNGGYVASYNYSKINSILRGDGYIGGELDDDDWETIKALRDAISNYRLDDNYIMTRYVGADYLTSVFGVKAKGLNDFRVNIPTAYMEKEGFPKITQELREHIGETITEKAFVSFSFLPGKNVMKGKAVRMKILAKKGTHCYVPVNKNESEGIFADGSNFVLRDVAWDEIERKWTLTLEIK